jgi:hypothetical protein
LQVGGQRGEKADDGTMASFSDADPMTVADPTITQTVTPAMTTERLDILMKRNCEVCEKLRVEMVG